jgi:hypothetical protein
VSGKKTASRNLADFVVDYGFCPVPITYNVFVGLELNRERARRRRVYHQSWSFAIANDCGDIDESVVAAACDTKQEAKKLTQEINAARAAERAGWTS